MGQLLASAPSVAAMVPVLERFYLSPGWTIDPETLVINAPDGHVPTGVVVRKSGKRYRFELV